MKKKMKGRKSFLFFKFFSSFGDIITKRGRIVIWQNSDVNIIDGPGPAQGMVENVAFHAKRRTIANSVGSVVPIIIVPFHHPLHLYTWSSIQRSKRLGIFLPKRERLRSLD